MQLLFVLAVIALLGIIAISLLRSARVCINHPGKELMYFFAIIFLSVAAMAIGSIPSMVQIELLLEG